MLRRVLLLALLASCGRKAPPAATAGGPARIQPEAETGESPAPEVAWPRFPDVTLPAAEGGEEPLADALVVTLTDGGRIFVGEKAVTLNELSTALAEHAALHPWRRISADLRASTTPVLLRADEGAPWGHAQWVLTICAEQKVYRTWFAVRPAGGAREPTAGPGKALKCFLPTDKGIHPGKPRVETFFVETHVRSTAFGDRPWADGLTVRVPTDFRYGFGESRTESVAELEGWIREELEAAEADGIAAAKVFGLVKAWQFVPTGKAVEVLAMYVRSGYVRTDLYGVAIPPPEVRKRETLPYPAVPEPR